MTKKQQRYFSLEKNDKELNLSKNKDFQQKYENVKAEINEVKKSTKVDPSELKQRFEI